MLEDFSAAPPGAIDTHAHVFTQRLPLAAERRYAPHYDATAGAYLALLDAHGLASGVLVQPSFLGTDNSYLLNAVATAPDRLAAVAVIDVHTPAEELDRLAAAGVCGIRLNLIGRPVPHLGEPAWQRLGRALAARALHLAVQARGPQWQELAPWLLRWPGTVVVDHLGLPPSSAFPHPGSAALFSVLDAEHIWVKASAPYRTAPGAADATLDRLLTAVGPQRMLWGSDWPWTQHEHARTYAATLDWLTARLSSAERRRVLCDNPHLLFGRLLTARRHGRTLDGSHTP